MKGIRVTKNMKAIKFEEVCGALQSKICFQRKKLTKYLRLTLVFTWNIAQLESFFQEFCPLIPDKNCGKNEQFLLPPIINVVLVHAIQGAWGQEHWNWEKGFFSEVGFVMLKNNVFAIIFCSGLSKIFGDYFVKTGQEMLSEFYISFWT